ncbi:MAG: hypothetical protein ACTSU4_09370 [Promethearchaeota archaeon]
MSSISIILFFPSAPLFFLILKNNKDFTFLEKLSLTIITNTCFYIIFGYIAAIFNIPIMGHYFFSILIIFFLLQVGYLKFQAHKGKTKKMLKTKSSVLTNINEFTLKQIFLKNFSLNSILLIIFIFLICILNLVRNPYFFGTDPWLHILIIKKITEMNYLPLMDYHDELGLHIFCAVIQFFSGVDHLSIPRYFIFYTYFISALVLYNLFMRIFKNQNLAVFGVFLLEFSMLGFSYMMLQFWPSGLAFIIGLEIFFLFYVRFQRFIQPNRPEWGQIRSSLKLYYSLILLFFTCSTLTHAITSITLLLPLISTYFIYLLKDCRRGFDFLLLIGLFGIYLVLTFLGVGYGHYYFLQPMSIPWYYVLGAVLIVGTIVWRFKKSLIFTSGRFSKAIKGERSLLYKKIEDKIILPLISSILLLILVIFIIGNILILNLNISFLFLFFDIFAFFSFSFWGLAVFQKKPRGKPITIWALSINFIFLGVLFIDLMTINEKVWTRILYLGSVAIIIGFVSYIYKIIKTDGISLMKYKILLLFIVFFSIPATAYYEHLGIANFSMRQREVRAIEWLSQHTSGKKVLIMEFGHDYVFLYYDYPYDLDNKSLRNFDLHYIISHENNYFDPANHVDEKGVNQLKKLKEEYGTDVYVVVDNFYFLNVGWQVYGQLSDEQLEQYYHLDYLNRIQSSRSINGQGTSYYWVI